MFDLACASTSSRILASRATIAVPSVRSPDLRNSSSKRAAAVAAITRASRAGDDACVAGAGLSAAAAGRSMSVILMAFLRTGMSSHDAAASAAGPEPECRPGAVAAADASVSPPAAGVSVRSDFRDARAPAGFGPSATRFAGSANGSCCCLASVPAFRVARCGAGSVCRIVTAPVGASGGCREDVLPAAGSRSLRLPSSWLMTSAVDGAAAGSSSCTATGVKGDADGSAVSCRSLRSRSWRDCSTSSRVWRGDGTCFDLWSGPAVIGLV